MELNHFKIIAFTHKVLDLKELGELHLEEEQLRLSLNNAMSMVQELMCLSTCNRVEFLFASSEKLEKKFLTNFLKKIYPNWSTTELEQKIPSAILLEGEAALHHLFNVASSIDSLVVGEREIITQVRNAFERSSKYCTTGELLRLIVKKTIETAKQVYTDTDIAKKPVSVVSLAYRKLRELNVKLDARVLIIGAGTTNTTMAKYLKKHGFKNFTLFNRTLAKAEALAAELNGNAFALKEIEHFTKGFDVMVTCTGSTQPIISKKIYTSLLAGDASKKIVIDLAVPNDLDLEIISSYDINLIAVNNLQSVAKENLKEREKQLDTCHEIIQKKFTEFKQTLRERKVELAMRGVPKKVKEIRETAINEVFAKDIEQMDEQGKEVLAKVVAYLEKKYISMPMKMAKEILIEEHGK